MKRSASLSTRFTRCEFVIAILLTLVLISFHVVFLFHAGSLWRDEISSLTLATKPTIAEFWESLRFDPFPAFYFLVLRVWDGIGFGQSDLALRALGFLVGALLIIALWVGSYLADKSPPLWPLALFAFNPLTLEAGDSLRPYGFGLIWTALAFGLIARITFNGVTKTVALCALVAAVLSVQSNFTNGLILFSIVAAAVFVLLTKRAWFKISLILGIGVVAVSSLLPYLPILSATKDWSKILANKNDIASVTAVAGDAVADSGAFVESTWFALIGAMLVFAVFVTVVRNRFEMSDNRARDRIVFAAIMLSLATAGMIGFLCAAKYLVFPRYFLGVTMIAAFSINIFWNTLANKLPVRTLSLGLILVVAIASLRPLAERARMRMTNCDQIAATLEQRAVPDDLVIVTSPFYAISFQRYYHGRASWITLPQVEDLTLHRWDLLKQAIMQPDPVPNLVSGAQNVLQAGHKVFLVGKLGPAPEVPPEPLPPAPQSQFGWQMEGYTVQWKSELTYWFEHHALHGTNVTVDQHEVVNPFEYLGLFEISGFREL